MKLYHYHKETGEYVGETDARLDPLETQKQGKDIYAIPAQASTDKPPATGSNKRAKRLSGGSGWKIVSDFRGSKYWLEDGTEIVITELGKLVPKDALSEAPPPPPLTEAELNEQKIQSKIRQMAIESLKANKELPSNFEG